MVKKAAYGLLAAFLAAGVYGAIPTTAEGWYTPSGGFSAASGTGTIYYGYDRATKQWQTAEVEVDEQGNISTPFESLPSDVQRDYDLMTAYQALTKALGNEAYNAVQDEAIQTIGKNLHDLTSKDGIRIRNENTGQEFTIKFGGSIATAASGSDGDIPATSDAADPADGRSLKWTEAEGGRKLEIGGWRAQASSGNLLDAAGVDVPVRETTGGAHVTYRTWNGVDGLTIAKDGSGKMGVAGWDGAPSGMATPLAEVLTKPAAMRDVFDGYKLLVRNPSKGLNYVDVGELDVGMKADGESVTTNGTDGAAMQGFASLYGWRTSGGVDSLADFMTMPKDAAVPGYEVLARHTDGEDVSLEYLSLGNLYGVTWATNWTEAVEHITKEETIKIVNWTTNWVNHTEYVTNYQDVVNVVTNILNHETFVTNVFNNESFVTNVFMHENFITNVWNNENFITNVFNHENFMTNIFNHEEFVTNVVMAYETISNFENFVTFQTNMFYNEVFITNVIDKYSAISNFQEFVTFQTNMFYKEEWITNIVEVKHYEFFTNAYEKLNTIENWTYVTNYIVRYLGGGGGGEEWGGRPGPYVEPQDAPYSPEYEPQEIDDDLLPVKNARTIVAITNSPFSKLDAHKMLDFRSVDTNGSARAQVFGFAGAPGNSVPVKTERDGVYALEWVDFPSDLVGITSNEIVEIRRWMRDKNVNNIFNTTVTNAEKFAEMRTNFFSLVAADMLLDGESVWTNADRRVEVKGYGGAPAYTVPYLDVTQATAEAGRDKDLSWERLPFADADANIRFGIVDSPLTIAAANTATPDSPYTFKMLSLYGFDDAEVGAVPVKAAQGLTYGLSWVKASSATNIILAGAGISITENGGGAITISATPEHQGAETSLVVVTDVRYDETTHRFQKKTRTITFRGTLGTESGWTDVFTAVSHRSEHEQEGD